MRGTVERQIGVGRYRGSQSRNRDTREGRLLARPLQAGDRGEAGLRALGLDGERDGQLYVPGGYDPARPAPLVLMLHGAGGIAQHSITRLMQVAEEETLILLAPDSRRQTWDVLYGEYGPDIDFIERALSRTFEQYAVDARYVAVEGFSDGASYALSVGITNGDLFTHIIAFSPGFMAPAAVRGAPRCFITHGLGDAVLPIDRCSRRIVPQLKSAGFPVEYREFDGPHIVPPDLIREAVDWFKQS
jgi:phospholipase/carboxylesterase